jgi:hypothetical protein
MRMMRCGKCGFPLWLSLAYRWNDNGTITYRMAPDFRVVLYHSDLFTELFSRIEESLGLPISHIVFEAQRNGSKAAIEVLLKLSPGFVRRNKLFKRFTVYFFCRLAVWMGASYSRVVSYEPGRSGEALIRNPYNRELMAALILGAFESLESRPFDHEWAKSEGDDVIRVTAAAGKPEVSERLAVAPDKSRPGNRALPRCSRCRVPLALSSLDWNEDEGIITDIRRGERANFMEAYANAAVFRELVEELGEDLNPLIVQAGKDFSRRHLEQLPGIGGKSEEARAIAWKVFSAEAMATLPNWGQGNPVDFRHEEDRTVVTVDNPFEERLIAGYLAAGFELVEGREGKVEWTSPLPSRVVYTIS